VVRTLCEVLDELRPAPRGGHATLIRFVTDRPGHDRRYAMDGTKLSSTLGFRPLESFTSGIGKTARWYLDHEEWWRKLMNAQYKDWLAQQYGENPGIAS